ncbi:hypothetical protein ACH4UR_24755 [Streptomyces lydicus]|uniref:hypothetical protein n=1 Tax=Streptomyces lydicus TaxID=47763 RepID=UPI0033FC2BB7
MAMFVVCGVIWLVALWGAVRCGIIWRRGADQLWAPRWEALSTTLWLMAFAVIATILLPLPVPPLYLAVLALLLTAAAIAAATARSAAVRRSEYGMRAMRLGLGLAVPKRLRHPATVAMWWIIPGCAAATAWMVTAAMRARPHMSPTAMDAAFEHAMVLAYVGTGLGLVHAVIQCVRRDREERRVRVADAAFLTGGSAEQRET